VDRRSAHDSASRAHGDELAHHAERGVEGDVAVHGPAARGAAGRGDEVEGAVIEPHPVHEASLRRDVDDVHELVVGKLEERGACPVVDEAYRLDREAVRMPGVAGKGVVADRQLEELPDHGEAARRNMRNRCERIGRSRPLIEGGAVDVLDRRLPRGGEGDPGARRPGPRGIEGARIEREIRDRGRLQALDGTASGLGVYPLMPPDALIRRTASSVPIRDLPPSGAAAPVSD